MKIGDTLKVKKNLIPGKVYGNVSFNRDMMKFRGKEVVIRDVQKNQCLIENSTFIFTKEMFENE